MPPTVLFPTMTFSPGNFGGVENSANMEAKHCYPGGDSTSSNRIFLSLYEEEEACEEPEWPEQHELGLSGVDAMEVYIEPRCEATYRPTIYFVSRIFDYIKGFHKVATFEVCSLQTYGTEYF